MVERWLLWESLFSCQREPLSDLTCSEEARRSKLVFSLPAWDRMVPLLVDVLTGALHKRLVRCDRRCLSC